MTATNQQSITAFGFNPPICSGPLEQIWPRTSILRTTPELDRALDYLSKLKLQPHEDRPRNWESLIALEAIVNSFGTEAKILDSGADTNAVILHWLSHFGYRNLYGINRNFQETFVRQNIVYFPTDFEQTNFPDLYFHAITCLSVLEHGTDIARHLSESWRLLKPAGLLISSFGYSGAYLGETHDKIPITRREILEFVRVAAAVGFEMLGDCGLGCDDWVVLRESIDLKDTHIILTMKKSD
jgi:SAM-dependent methyltransferase